MADTTIGPERVNFDLGSLCHDTDNQMGDDTKIPKTPTDPHSWRLDPEESLSDWTIVIASVSLGGNTVTTYHVHKYVLGAGPRGSQYFRGLFKSTQQLSIELDISAAAAFPVMLDFMYEIHSTDVDVSPSTAVAVRYLAKYFEVPTLFDNVNKFIQKDMDKDNIHIYVKEAKVYQDEHIINSTMEVGAQAWNEIHENRESQIYGELLPPEKLLHFTKLVGRANARLVKQLTQKRKRSAKIG